MRWEGKEIPGDYIPIILHLKTLPHALREQIARDLIHDSDGSVASATLFEQEEKGETPARLSDVERWVSGLDDEFEPVCYAVDGSDEVSTQTKSSRLKATSTIDVIQLGVRSATEDEGDAIYFGTPDLESIRSVQEFPSADLLTTTSQEIPFEAEPLNINLKTRAPSPSPSHHAPRLQSNHRLENCVKHPTGRPEWRPAKEMKLFEGGDTWEDVEELDETWYIPLEDVDEELRSFHQRTMGRRQSKGRNRIREELIHQETQIQCLQKEMAKEPTHGKIPSLLEPTSHNAFHSPFTVKPTAPRTALPPSIDRKEEKNRVMEWIKECEKPEILDLMDDEPRPKVGDLSENVTPPDNLLELDYELPSTTTEYFENMPMPKEVRRPPSRASSIETGGSVELPRAPKHRKRHNLIHDKLHQPVSSIMTLNPATQKYENPPPRWFNKDTGEYEHVKPTYFVDPTNPMLGMVGPTRVTQEDAAFRQFLLDKEERRRIRAQREAEELHRAESAAKNPSPTPPLKPHKPQEKINASAEGFDDELAQKSFREITGKMFSKRGATTFPGPAMEKEEQQRQELERRYRALKPFAPSDQEIGELPSPVDQQAILDAWKNSAAIRATPKIKKPAISETERAKALVRNKSGSKKGCTLAAMRQGHTFMAMKGSYIPPNSMAATTVGDGWEEVSGVVVASRECQVKEDNEMVKKVRNWRKDQLHSEAWWDRSGKEDGRLALNPVTGKLEDRGSPSSIALKIQPQGSQHKSQVSLDLLMSSPRIEPTTPSATKREKRMSFEEFLLR